jgi:hypothetical protein
MPFGRLKLNLEIRALEPLHTSGKRIRIPGQIASRYGRNFRSDTNPLHASASGEIQFHSYNIDTEESVQWGIPSIHFFVTKWVFFSRQGRPALGSGVHLFLQGP